MHVVLGVKIVADNGHLVAFKVGDPEGAPHCTSCDPIPVIPPSRCVPLDQDSPTSFRARSATGAAMQAKRHLVDLRVALSFSYLVAVHRFRGFTGRSHSASRCSGTSPTATPPSPPCVLRSSTRALTRRSEWPVCRTIGLDLCTYPDRPGEPRLQIPGGRLPRTPGGRGLKLAGSARSPLLSRYQGHLA